jgi:hypothetical protein
MYKKGHALDHDEVMVIRVRLPIGRYCAVVQHKSWFTSPGLRVSMALSPAEQSHSFWIQTWPNLQPKINFSGEPSSAVHEFVVPENVNEIGGGDFFLTVRNRGTMRSEYCRFALLADEQVEGVRVLHMERRLNPAKDFEFQPPAAEFDLMNQMDRERRIAALCTRCHSEVSSSASSAVESHTTSYSNNNNNTTATTAATEQHRLQTLSRANLDRNLDSVARHLRELELAAEGRDVEEHLSYDDGAGTGVNYTSGSFANINAAGEQSQANVTMQPTSSSSSAASSESSGSQVSAGSANSMSSGSLIDEDEFAADANPLRKVSRAGDQMSSSAGVTPITQWPIKSLSASQLRNMNEMAGLGLSRTRSTPSPTKQQQQQNEESPSSRRSGRMQLMSDSLQMSKDQADSFTRSL